VQRLENEVDAVETPIGNAPRIEDLDVTELDVTNSDLAAALAVNNAEWKQEAELIADWFNNIGEKLPNEMREELIGLNQRL
jgi:phosphoenolpyruvate carboxykinase (GTP)